MARLIVDARGHGIRARAGNTNSARLLVSVSDDEGRGVDGLATSAFRLTTMLVPAGGSTLEITAKRRVGSPLPGLYTLSVAPTSARAWRGGLYILALGVSERRGEGQTLVELEIP